MPNIQITQNNNISNISYTDNKQLSLLTVLRNHGYRIPSPCGGNGFCNKCNVYVNNHIVKACSYIPNGDISVIIPDYSDIVPEQFIQTLPVDKKSEFKIAVDIGSTSISLAIVTNDIISKSTIANPSCVYGGDIISRAQSSAHGNEKIISKLIVNSLETEVTRLIRKNKLDTNNLKAIYISCNTAMQLMTLGLDCTGILSYPFEVQNFDHSFTYKSYPVHIIPSFGTFVGGDIVSGLSSLMPIPYKKFLFVDIGTNAEIVLSVNDKIYCTSAAAGPAFEGANISCGTAYIPGAIDTVTITDSGKSGYKISYTTIDNKIPCGICGTGILEIYSHMIKLGIVDKYKTLKYEYADNGFRIARSQNGFLTITQNDIRQIQLAVSAIHTAIDILILKAGIVPDELEQIYISGSFGSSIKPHILNTISLLPDKLFNRDIIIFAGNTSLSGAVDAALLNKTPEDYYSLIESCTEIELANDPFFNNMFINNL